jgi:hypothetical protein
MWGESVRRRRRRRREWGIFHMDKEHTIPRQII